MLFYIVGSVPFRTLSPQGSHHARLTVQAVSKRMAGSVSTHTQPPCFVKRLTDRYDDKTDIYSLGMLLFELCHPAFGTKMERTVVLTNAHRLAFPPPDVWGPPKGQEALRALCRSMLLQRPEERPSAADIVQQVWAGALFAGCVVFCCSSITREVSCSESAVE